MKALTKAYAHTHVFQEGLLESAIDIVVAETPARISLFENPTVVVAGSRLDIRPPLAYQVLVALALTRSRTVSRSEMASTLFPSVDPKERRAQLRIVLSRLRRSLHEQSVLDFYTEAETDLRLDHGVEIDAYEVLSGEPISFDRLSAYSRPVLLGCQSRFAERCRGQVKNLVEASLPAILASIQSISDLWTISPILGRIRSLYPLSATICGFHVAVLKRLDLFEEATREISEFEVGWLEQYGPQDRPDIDKIVERIKFPVEDGLPS